MQIENSNVPRLSIRSSKEMPRMCRVVEKCECKVITQIDKAITAAAFERAIYGAYINGLEDAQDNLMNVAQNTDASRSRIEDADYAAETSELARTQIISQASTAMLSQAKQSVLALLQY